MKWYQLVVYTLFLVATVYLVNCALARRIRRVEFQYAAVYVTTMVLLGVFGEVFVGSVYHYFFGKPLWTYHVAPIHHGYTSYFAPVIWGALGFYLYLLHDYLKARNIEKTLHLAALFSVETLALELLANGSFRLFFGHYLFYYLPHDLWHFTSIQTLPFYFPAGVIVVKTIRRFRVDPRFFSIMCLLFTLVLVYMAN